MPLRATMHCRTLLCAAHKLLVHDSKQNHQCISSITKLNPIQQKVCTISHAEIWVYSGLGVLHITVRATSAGNRPGLGPTHLPTLLVTSWAPEVTSSRLQPRSAKAPAICTQTHHICHSNVLTIPSPDLVKTWYSHKTKKILKVPKQRIPMRILQIKTS